MQIFKNMFSNSCRKQMHSARKELLIASTINSKVCEEAVCLLEKYKSKIVMEMQTPNRLVKHK